MIIDINELRKHDFQLSDINVILQKPKYRRLTVNNRRVNGFLFIIKGNCRYVFDEGSFSLEPDSVVYLPSGSNHVFEIYSDDIEFYRVDFRLSINGELVLFSKSPKKMCASAPRECIDAVKELLDTCLYMNDSIKKNELICAILRTLSATPENKSRDRLAPAISYLIEHFTEDINCGELARLCHLSSSQFYNLFHNEYKVSPLAYRDSLLIRKAMILLQDMFSVTEVAEILGFESVSYFSRFFKKHCNISPSKYQSSLARGEASLLM